MKIEDVRNGIAADPELKNLILTDFDTELPEYLRGKGFKVRTADEDETEFGNRLKPKVAELYGNIEKDVLESLGVFGLKKEGNTEKVYDLIKKAPGLINAKLKELQDQLTAAQAGKNDDVTTAQINALKAEIETLKGEKTTLATEYSQKELGFKVSRAFDTAFAELQVVVPATVAEAEKADYITSRSNLLKAALASKYTVKEENGKLVWMDADGNVKMNGTEVATTTDLLKADFKYDFEAVKKAGSGSKGGAGDNASVVVQTKDQLYAQLAKEGLIAGSKEWITRSNELASKNGIDLTK